jgi:hypothetical protein
MTPKQRPRFKLRPPAPPPRPPKPPRAPGVTLDSLRERMNRPFIEALARFATEGTDAVAKACDRPLFPGLSGAAQAMVGGLTEREQQVLKERFGVPKRSRKDIASDIENTTINIHTAKGRQERETMRTHLRDLFRELDDLDKP